MKRFIFAAALLASSAVFGVSDKGGTAADKAAVLKLHSDFTEHWAQHDARGLSSLFAADADMINPMGRAAHGREEIEKLFADEHSGNLKTTTMVQKCDSVRFLSPEIAQVDCTYSVSGMTGPGAPPEGTMRGHVTDIAVKQGDGWKVEVLRAMTPRMPNAQQAAGRETTKTH